MRRIVRCFIERPLSTAPDHHVSNGELHNATTRHDLFRVPESPTEEDMAPLRDRIDAIDKEVLALLNERMQCAHVIGAIKKHLGMPIYVPSREEEVLRNVTISNPGPLDEPAVRRVFERIIDETRSLERRRFQEPPESH
jgi:chorismate mutase